MSNRFKAPKHTSAIFSHLGEHRANSKGEISLPDDAPASAIAQILAAGCEPIGEKAPPAQKAPAKSGGKAKAKAAKPAPAADPESSSEPPAA